MAAVDRRQKLLEEEVRGLRGCQLERITCKYIKIKKHFDAIELRRNKPGAKVFNKGE